jgi:pimeloyl-ACP methyl ester carboxylesterase
MHVFRGQDASKGIALFPQLCRRLTSRFADGATLFLINSAPFRLRNEVCTRVQLETYLAQGERMTREEFFAVSSMLELTTKGSFIQWRSPIQSGYAENDIAAARLFLSPQGWVAPTLVFLHSLMSASDFGYRRIARRLNRAGWNAALVHLPFHYSRVPRGSINGALALSANLPRNGETIRQAVKEVRQLLALFRERGCTQFGLIGTSFGGWVGALVSFLEEDLSYMALLQPVADVENAIWVSPAGEAIRSQLEKASIPAGITRRHAHLTSPMSGRPLIDPDRILLVGGRFDSIVPLHVLRNLRDAWPGSRLLEVDQGHFGYAAMRAALREFEALRPQTPTFP